MYRATTIAAAFVLAVTGAVSGQEINAGAMQLARSLGVEPRNYTVSQLVQMHLAREGGDWVRVENIKRGKRVGVFSAKSYPTTGRIAYAEKLGIDPTSMSYADMRLLGSAKASGQPGPVAAFWKNRDPNNPSRNPGFVSPGEAQIAAGLGVDPADYTLSELTRMKALAED